MPSALATLRRLFAVRFRSLYVDVILLIKAAIMGIVEGLTEFLPVSSTGHLILTGSLLGLTDAKSKVFDIAIQSGAILAVLIVYWARIREALGGITNSAKQQRFVLNIAIGFLPAGIVGLTVYKAIKAHLFNAPVVAGAFIVGALIILWAEKRAQPVARVQTVDDMTALDALKVGLVQCLGMIPGTSRSGATIIGGMLLGLSRKAATDFSFYGRSATRCPSPMRRCSRSASSSASWPPGPACAGCCATWPRTTSCPSPGTASPSASSFSQRG
jgi:undecaprenyl-diphosphatase